VGKFQSVPVGASLAGALDAVSLPADKRTSSDHFGLTPRELEVIHELASGGTNGRIAGDLAISGETVKRHLSNIFDKLGVSSRLEVALFAVHHQLLDRHIYRAARGDASAQRTGVLAKCQEQSILAYVSRTETRSLFTVPGGAAPGLDPAAVVRPRYPQSSTPSAAGAHLRRGQGPRA